ncbi:type II toxin-antitoxin system Phd/YefM family antitoxin [Rhizobium grahamii]|uniref:Antitoxin n=1 Tax=Rhizobium grahamii TaxID=1120045 RepID=A0A5Q0C5J1_9HYPH|nr:MULTISPECIES: type II toxin-antitoxin system Phd/YefM family antitoxin [Rhizobium]QFY59191.1 type II toxin-antitoxin system Phd/YefM family antitoxin [Rhizobium grahamii]QRM48285.1 type II toxin-antitoxin system Phd/YefM family antitoxin [Rhizobium sp. BG6]
MCAEHIRKLRRNGQRWKLEDAKARFSEVVRMAHSEGPQRVTVRGRDSVVVISAEELDRLMQTAPKQLLVEFLEGLALDGLEVERDRDEGRDVAL